MHGGSSGPSVCFLFPVIPMGGEICGLGPRRRGTRQPHRYHDRRLCARVITIEKFIIFQHYSAWLQ